MPHKGFYTQGLAILLREAATLDAIEELLTDFTVVKRGEGSTSWAIAGPSLVVAYRPEVNGYVSVDITDHRWPDGMGNPQTESEVFAAWSMGHFGPGAWPGSFERACQHSWGWPDGRTVPLQHQAFIRIRSSYIFGASENTPIMPSDYDPLHELEFATRIAAALVRLPQALCYFNPNGECVRGASQLLDSLSEHASAKQMPLDVWSNVRFFNLQDIAPAWTLMDTVGMSQLDAPDHEAYFQSTAYEPGEVDRFLRNTSLYVAKQGPVIRDGDTTDGPGNVRWQGFNMSEGRVAPPRQVIRWFPVDRRKIPAELTGQPTRKATSSNIQDLVGRLWRRNPRGLAGQDS
jgi:Domain of unknown function (DUF4261)